VGKVMQWRFFYLRYRKRIKKDGLGARLFSLVFLLSLVPHYLHYSQAPGLDGGGAGARPEKLQDFSHHCTEQAGGVPGLLIYRQSGFFSSGSRSDFIPVIRFSMGTVL